MGQSLGHSSPVQGVCPSSSFAPFRKMRQIIPWWFRRPLLSLSPYSSWLNVQWSWWGKPSLHILTNDFKINKVWLPRCGLVYRLKSTDQARWGWSWNFPQKARLYPAWGESTSLVWGGMGTTTLSNQSLEVSLNVCGTWCVFAIKQTTTRLIWVMLTLHAPAPWKTNISGNSWCLGSLI